MKETGAGHLPYVSVLQVLKYTLLEQQNEKNLH